ncbi:MAG TPA: metallophosphoesterase [Tepidisphaeraceae bacterium]|jgi:Icc-related predicted phosphoesterase|nr:metallophosphoesterase [Tepidisphaeraceae bacterium]
MSDNSKNGQPSSPARIAAVGDLHCKTSSQGAFHDLFARISQDADVMVLCGDLTDHGLAEEAHVLVRELSTASAIPAVAVLGNHDFESGKADEVRKILCDAGVHLLDGDATEVRGIGFAGAKGFAGGFGRGTLSAFGEPIIKRFVQEAVEEAMKLEAALLRLRTPHRLAVLHYAPIAATVEGEPREIFPFLGCSRLEEPLNRYRVNACVHGHAHNGTLEGRTTAGAVVYNVSLPLLRKRFPDRPPFRLISLGVEDEKNMRITEAVGSGG